MSDQNSEPSEQMEELLRKWGADEAAEQADASGLPVPQLPRRGATVWRWLSLAASVALFAGAAVLFAVALSRERGDDMAAALNGTSKADKETLAKLRAEVASANKELDDTKKNLKKTEDDLAALRNDLQVAQRELTAERARSAEKLDALVKQRVAEAVKSYEAKFAAEQAEHKKQLAEVNGALEVARGERDTAAKELAALQEDGERRQAEAERERARLTQLITKQGEELAVYRKAALPTFRGVYLSTFAPGRSGVAARQEAVRVRRLLERGSELRPRTQRTGDVKLYDTLEVLLTRLDLLDTGDAAAVGRFRKLIARAAATDRIKRAFFERAPGPEVSAWLMEVQLVLSEM